MATGTSVVLLEASVIVNDVTAVKSSPIVKGNADVAVPGLTTWVEILEMVGGPLTVRVKLVVAVRPPPSVTVSVIVVVPLCPTAGVSVTVREAPDPPKTTFALGSNVVLLDAPVTTSEAAGVTTSPTVNGSAEVDT